MPLIGSRLNAAVTLVRGNPRPWQRRRLFGNRLAWAARVVRGMLDDRRKRRSHPSRS